MKIIFNILILFNFFNVFSVSDSKLDIVIEQHIKILRNLNKKNNPLIILFSATPGMGKTTIANELQNKLLAIKITLDDARNLLKNNKIYPQGSQEDKINFIMNYLNKLLLKVKKRYKNKLIILDDSVDVMYQ